MRILRVAQKCYPEVPGGGTYHVHAMSRDQEKMGHDVTVLTVAADPALSHVEELDGYTVVRYPSTLAPAGNDISAGLARHLATVDDSAYDVCQAHSHLYFSTNLAALKRRLSDLPLAITNHGLYSQSAPEWVFDAYLRSMDVQPCRLGVILTQTATVYGTSVFGRGSKGSTTASTPNGSHPGAQKRPP